MSLTSIASGRLIGRTLATSLGRSSQANCDRYGIIRKFFQVQFASGWASAKESVIPKPHRNSPLSRRGSFGGTLSLTYAPGQVHHFHSTCAASRSRKSRNQSWTMANDRSPKNPQDPSPISDLENHAPRPPEHPGPISPPSFQPSSTMSTLAGGEGAPRLGPSPTRESNEASPEKSNTTEQDLSSSTAINSEEPRLSSSLSSKNDNLDSRQRKSSPSSENEAEQAQRTSLSDKSLPSSTSDPSSVSSWSTKSFHISAKNSSIDTGNSSSDEDAVLAGNSPETSKQVNKESSESSFEIHTSPSPSQTTPSQFPSPSRILPIQDKLEFLDDRAQGSSSPPPLAHDVEHYSRFFRRLAASLPHLHRPTRDDFLKVANGFWQRMNVRFKWFTIKSFRKFNADDISAFVTWFVMSQTIWILIGTTTFFSVIFAIANSLRLQNFVARAISDYLTSETGVTIIFESAIVPKWKDSRISFKNVYISRRPTTSAPSRKSIGHAAALGYDVSDHPANHGVEEEEETSNISHDDFNYAMFDLNVDSIDVTLSLWRWLDGKGLVEDAVVKGIRGILDRRSVSWDPDNPLNPADYRHKYQPGDFELKSLQIEDLLITVYQPGGFRPYTASIFRADIRCFRKRWLFYDFLCAENIVGQFDNCLLSLHKPQSIGRTTEMDLKDADWARMSRIRIDGVNVDHLQHSTSMEGPISWITSGKVDAVLDIKFPRDPKDSLQFNALLGEIADAITTSFSNPTLELIPGQRELIKPPLTAPDVLALNEDEGRNTPSVIVDIDLRFRDVKAAIPIFTGDLSYVNNALVRPIVAFMNANRTLVPIHCRVVKSLDDFDGSWNLWDSGLMDEISLKMYDALAYHVTEANMNRRLKTVTIWSLQKTASAVLSALRNAFDPVSAHFKQSYLDAKIYDGVHPSMLRAYLDTHEMYDSNAM
ncbi:mitochondrial distribution and morphology proteins-domain-containing protein [Desarmillaria tabescens]|uniref:Mitochondrial distribution and morphology proteins-domain-containing protein n=1 Tax=Armillaria tabescens TaxID=1929756 RepID=A0AA39K6N1_ARMTA|nr:mitochondrial distribution and morphology proteins-domain-containing protein [Desarmillaria tabescens]KAK0455485.1 mitochondrial distribution and morphology proteins-domain-containing protein [Desarmillaria tabescens]